jgi:hypothetical protein
MATGPLPPECDGTDVMSKVETFRDLSLNLPSGEQGRSPSSVQRGPDDDIPICAFVHDVESLGEPPRHPTQFDRGLAGERRASFLGPASKSTVYAATKNQLCC